MIQFLLSNPGLLTAASLLVNIVVSMLVASFVVGKKTEAAEHVFKAVDKHTDQLLRISNDLSYIAGILGITLRRDI